MISAVLPKSQKASVERISVRSSFTFGERQAMVRNEVVLWPTETGGKLHTKAIDRRRVVIQRIVVVRHFVEQTCVKVWFARIEFGTARRIVEVGTTPIELKIMQLELGKAEKRGPTELTAASRFEAVNENVEV